MGLVSIFTSCVDGDYYDFYDDEEELLSPRSKKGKEIPSDLDFSDYPKMYSDWHEAECVAWCFANLYTHGDAALSRYFVIKAQYGRFKKRTYNKYFDAVDMVGGDLPGISAQDLLFGPGSSNEKDLDDFVDQLLTYHGGGGAQRLLLFTNNCRHVLLVNYINIYNRGGGAHEIAFNVSDKDGTRSYIVIADSNNNITQNNNHIECLRYCDEVSPIIDRE